MLELTDRQKMVLGLVVHEHIRTAAPVGSLNLVENFNLDLSSATVRNDLSALTDMGYLRQPHTSAGRAPTEDGYRYFVSQLLQEPALPAATRRTISHQFYQMSQDMEQWMRLAASVLAQHSRAASLVTAPHPEQARFKHLELVATRGRQLLMVLVTEGGEILQRFLTLNEPVAQDKLSMIADQITHLAAGFSTNQLNSIRNGLEPLAQDMLDLVAEEMQHSNSLIAGEVYLDGLTFVLAEPEFSGSEDARRALRLLEERPRLQDLLTRTGQTANFGGVQVLIGGEGAWEDLRQCSVILSRYGAPGQASGTLGVLGPMRMSYERSISTVRFLSGLLTEMISDRLTD